MSRGHSIDGGVLTLRNEFAAVSVEIDLRGSGPRLKIVNCQNGMSVCLDPLELASLTWLDHMSLGPFLDPSNTGWSSDQGAPDDPDH